MSLQSKLASFKQERADAASRNIGHSRPAPNAPARTSTPQADAGTKRDRDAAFSSAPAPTAPSMSMGGAGREILTNVKFAIDYLKSKSPQALPFEEIIRHLSLPNDAGANVENNIRKGLEGHEQVTFIPKGPRGAAKDTFKYRPKHPVTNSEELKDYLARQSSARGIMVKELKDGWPNCLTAIDKLEEEGAVLVIRNVSSENGLKPEHAVSNVSQKKDNTPKTVFADSPGYHLQIDQDFKDFWAKTKLPASEGEVRAELDKAGITPTSQVKEMKKNDGRRRERKKPNRRGGKLTNSHMTGILKEYARK
ncbi:Transcription initiation factor IIE subunit beta [Lecanosticta acicola]|uniref:Transcription initiation factor IIE subunit beta n=1 Tax=Lecanosticta acicola TaxID=111012 RepID=A0AAI8Z0T5_9PEZI|nr:Transcription initiation factor IIE subunit beta [Lecanosticta acicola]